MNKPSFKNLPKRESATEAFGEIQRLKPVSFRGIGADLLAEQNRHDCALRQSNAGRLLLDSKDEFGRLRGAMKM